MEEDYREGTSNRKKKKIFWYEIDQPHRESVIIKQKKMKTSSLGSGVILIWTSKRLPKIMMMKSKFQIFGLVPVIYQSSSLQFLNDVKFEIVWVTKIDVSQYLQSCLRFLYKLPLYSVYYIFSYYQNTVYFRVSPQKKRLIAFGYF